jgi:hypothetical protein
MGAKFSLTVGGLRWGEKLKLSYDLEGCMRSMQYNVEFWVPTQHLLKDQGKPRKTVIKLAGRRTFRMQTVF